MSKRRKCVLCSKKASYKILRTNKRGKRKVVFACKKHRKKVLKQKKNKFPSSSFEVIRLIRGVETGKVHKSDCLEFMQSLPSNSVDSIITDPPYGLKFMSKKWDYDVPSIEVFQEMLRVAKPGAVLLCFGGSRTFHRMACNIEDAGWEIRDTILWMYGSGFPKGGDISKHLDKKLKKERKVVGVAGKSGSKRSCMAGDFTGGEYLETAPVSEEAKLWEGWKTIALKPAYEPIILGMKPLEGTYVDNALKYGVAGLNIGGSLISYKDEKDKAQATPQGECTSKKRNVGAIPDAGAKQKRTAFTRPEQKGRYPANVILDEEAGQMLDKQTGILKSGKPGIKHGKNDGFAYGKESRPPGTKMGGYGDSGGASRFFYCPKATKKERNEGLIGMKEKPAHHDGRKKNYDCPAQRNDGLQQNYHPTVKPVALMKWLATLTKTPTGGLVLDPYAGSGSTCLGCIESGRGFLACDRDKGYTKIANRRIKYWKGKNNE